MDTCPACGRELLRILAPDGSEIRVCPERHYREPCTATWTDEGWEV